MKTTETIKVFEEKQVRTLWDDAQEQWYVSIIDVIEILTDSKDYQTARKYWNKLKQRLKEESNQTVTNCHQLKMRAADGKMRLTDVANTELEAKIGKKVVTSQNAKHLLDAKK